MKKSKIFIIIVFSFVLVAEGYARGDIQSSLAIQSAGRWLQTLDQKEFVSAAKLTSSVFNSENGKAEADYLVATRRPFGRVIGRTLVKSEAFDRLPGLKQGQYQVLLFKTIFVNKTLGYETVNLHLDKDAKWRVSGYYIR